jgi:hypothetical protein
MRRALPLLLLGAAFAVVAFVTVQVNRAPRHEVTPAMRAELTALLRANDLTPRPMIDPPGRAIDNALRYATADCTTDSFLLPLRDTSLTTVQSARFSELTGVVYRSRTLKISEDGSVLQARALLAMSAFKAAFGFYSSRNGHTVLTFFTPEDCDSALPNMRAFWALDRTDG